MAFKNTGIIRQKAKQMTKNISVWIIEDGKKIMVWSKGTSDTNKNHEHII